MPRKFLSKNRPCLGKHPFITIRSAQTFNLTLDLDMYYAYVFDSKLQEATCKGVVARPRRFFDRSQSKTYKELDYDFPFLVESDAYFV